VVFDAEVGFGLDDEPAEPGAVRMDADESASEQSPGELVGWSGHESASESGHG